MIVCDSVKFVIKQNNIRSDRHETLVAVSGKDALNPGDKMAVTLDVGYSNKIGKIQGSVEAVTVQDIMENIQAPSYIIKTDIQKYDCKVLFVDSIETLTFKLLVKLSCLKVNAKLFIFK